MDAVNDTLAAEVTRAPPDNPMYAGGIAVLVAFVLFMYWGSLHEKEDNKDETSNKPKKRTNPWFSRHKRHRKKRTKNPQTGVYIVSDDMNRGLLSSVCDDQHCAECEVCRLATCETQDKRAHLLSKSTQTNSECHANCRRATSSVSNVRAEQRGKKPLPQRKRAHSSPEIRIAKVTDACTCARPWQNGGVAVPRCLKQKGVAVAWSEYDPNTANKVEGDADRKLTYPGIGKGTDVLYYERETKNNLADLERSYGKTVNKVNIVDDGKRGGKVRHQLEDAFVRLESHPDVTISVVAETIV